jgi:hypothetical protein
MVMLEAETAQAAIARGGHAWSPSTARADFAGDGFVVALPDAGDNVPASDVAASAELRFAVAFAEPGTYVVWVRGWAPNGGGDSLHVGLDDQGATTAATITGFTGDAWAWSDRRADGTVAVLAVAAAGTHTVHVWMREDGFALDRLILTTRQGYAPDGKGPRPSPRVDAGDAPAVPTATPTPGTGDGTAGASGNGPPRRAPLPLDPPHRATGDGTDWTG